MGLCQLEPRDITLLSGPVSDRSQVYTHSFPGTANTCILQHTKYLGIYSRRSLVPPPKGTRIGGSLEGTLFDLHDGTFHRQ
ncbi:hypothetical protein CHS0354_025401 [Potamilus streckersoni]|uniref:Uncharacterized protein n=1 Tax=Potamilus streckersoni TaxID=2493646 RepID=A0AAE0VYW3_9BIVA|nr:hypothetical protein CHS0354_025401 [Potamilus streckersoni]